MIIEIVFGTVPYSLPWVAIKQYNICNKNIKIINYQSTDAGTKCLEKYHNIVNCTSRYLSIQRNASVALCKFSAGLLCDASFSPHSCGTGSL